MKEHELICVLPVVLSLAAPARSDAFTPEQAGQSLLQE